MTRLAIIAAAMLAFVWPAWAGCKVPPFAAEEAAANPFLISDWEKKCFHVRQAEIENMPVDQQIAAQLSAIARELHKLNDTLGRAHWLILRASDTAGVGSGPKAQGAAVRRKAAFFLRAAPLPRSRFTHCKLTDIISADHHISPMNARRTKRCRRHIAPSAALWQRRFGAPASNHDAATRRRGNSFLLPDPRVNATRLQQKA